MRVFILTVSTIFLASAIWSCGRPAIGVSRCGAVVHGGGEDSSKFPEPMDAGGVPHEWSMEVYSEMERVALWALEQSSDPRLKNGCAKMKDVDITINTVDIWKANGIRVAGLTRCGIAANFEKPWVPHLVWINNVYPAGSSLAHELAHVLQSCDPKANPDITVGEDPTHAGWHANGIYSSIDLYFETMRTK